MTDAAPHAKRSILVVDDDADYGETLQDALSFEGLTVALARDGREALTWLREHPRTPWVVVLDLMMPVMDGRAFLDAKANDPVLSSIPVIVLTAGGDCTGILASGQAVDCLTKTADLRALLASIASCH
jgi:two-component system, chemotaxis family, chemotaxis protein CheY